MSKDYKNIRSKKKQKPINTEQIKSFFSGLAIGLCVAIIVYFFQHEPEQSTGVKQPDATTEMLEPVLDQTNDTPPPSFEFYEILPNMKVNVSEWEAEEEEENMEIATEAINKKSEIHILQIGSFRQYEAADEVKAKLALMGITADIQRVVINGKDIRHRVRVGPYDELGKLSVVRQQLLENNLSYILLRLQ